MEMAESGRIVIDTGSDGRGSTGCGDAGLLSTSGCDNDAGLAPVAGFAVPADFDGVGLDGEVAWLFEVDWVEAGLVSGLSWSVASAPVWCVVPVVRSSLPPIGIKIDFSRLMNY